MQLSLVGSQSGQMLIQVLISVVIMGIIAVVFASIMATQFKRNQGSWPKIGVKRLGETIANDFG